MVFHSISFFICFRILVFRLNLSETFFLLFLCSCILCLVVLAWPLRPLDQARAYVGRQLVLPQKVISDISHLATQLVCSCCRSLSRCLLKSFIYGLCRQWLVVGFFPQPPFIRLCPSIPALGEWRWFRFPLSILANITHRSGHIRECIRR